MVWKRNPAKAKPATVSLLISASMVLLAGITPPAGADTASDLQQFADTCVDIVGDGEDPICVPNLDQICGDVGPVSCELEESACEFFCEDEDGVELVLRPIFTVEQPEVRAWATTCEVATVNTVQLAIGDAPQCILGDDVCPEHGEPGETPVCWEVELVPEDEHPVERPDVEDVEDGLPLSVAALCSGALTVSVAGQPVLSGTPAIAPCSLTS